MKTTADRAADGRAGREGQTFVVVMMLTGILMIAGASLTYLTSNASLSSRKINNGARALALAEAGVADRISKMTTNYLGWANASNSVSYGGGSYSVVGALQTNGMNCLIRSTGTLGIDRRTVALELLGTIYMVWDLVVNVDGAIISEGNIGVDQPATVHGDIRGNGDITGTTKLIDGTVQVQGTSTLTYGDDPDKVTGGVTEGQPQVEVPDYRDEIDLWRARAMTDPAYYFTNSAAWAGVGGTIPDGGSLSPTSGVIFVDGDVTLTRKVLIRGTMVVTGSVLVEQQLLGWESFNTNWPCIIAVVNFECQNQNNYPGTIFAGSTITISNRRTINGCLISMGTVSVGGNTDVWAPGGAPAWDPNDTNKAAPPIIPGPWLL